MSRAGPLDRLLSLQHLGIKFGLDNIRALCRALDHPERRFDSIHIAGTNGKGSVTAIVDHALRAAGIATGRYTSPHLIDLEERFAIGGIPVGTDALTRAAGRVLATADELIESKDLPAPPTFFEATTAIAFLLFAEAGVSTAVVEVGLGGRLDATNIVVPVLTAITTVDFDHQQLLGDSLESIAFEKAGIIKAHVPVVIGERKKAATDVIRRIAVEREAPLIDAWAGSEVHTDGVSVRITTPRGSYGPVRLGLLGEHQAANALVAVRVLETLPPRLRVAADTIADAIRDVRWLARLQWIDFADGRRLLIDAAHNTAGAAALASFLEAHVERRIPIVLALMKDKDARGIIEVLAPHASLFVLTKPGTGRAADPETLAALVRDVAPSLQTSVRPAPLDAVNRAFESGSTICACGSIFLAGEILALERQRWLQETP